MNIAYLCIVLLGFLMMGLSFYVSFMRGKTGKISGTTEDPECPLYQAQRAHGNTTENAPMLAVMMLVLAQTPQPTWVTATIITATIFRFILVAGLIFPATMAKPNALRFVGGLGSILSAIVLAVATLLQII